MNDELESMWEDIPAVEEEAETPLPSLEEQKNIAAKLKQLEKEGKLTPEILEQYFGQFNDKDQPPVH